MIKTSGKVQRMNWGRFIQEEVIKTLNAYEAQPKLVQRDYKEEREISRGDYAPSSTI